MKEMSFYKQHKTACILFFLFAGATLIRALIAGYAKHIYVLPDELMYYAMAENLAKGRGFPVLYYGMFSTPRKLYSILIAPAFFTVNRRLQFFLIALINSTFLCSGMYPTYLLAKDAMNRRWGIFCAVLYLFLPDMVYGMSFMTDLLVMPLGTWMIYLSYRLMAVEEINVLQRIGYIILYGLLGTAAVYTKKASLIFIICFLGCFVVYQVLSFFIKRGMNPKRVLLLLVFLGLIAGGLYGIIHITNLTGAVKGWYNWSLSEYRADGQEFVKYFLYFAIQVLMAGGFFPILLPLAYVRVLDAKGKRLLLYMSVLTVVFTAATNIVSYFFREIGRVHLRYMMFLWMPHLVLLCKLYFDGVAKASSSDKSAGKMGRVIGWIIIGAISVAIAYFYVGPQKASDIEYTLLYWAEGWGAHRLRYGVAFLALVAVCFVLLKKKKLRLAFGGFVAVWVALQAYDNVEATICYKEEYAVTDEEYEELSAIEEFVRDHNGDTFVLLDAGDDSSSAYEHLNFDSSKISDTYLNYPNVVRTSLWRIMDTENYTEYNEYDASLYGFTVYQPWYSSLGGYSLTDDVDYLILPVEAMAVVEDSACRRLDLGEGNLYAVYELAKKNILPDLDSLRYPERGHNIYEAAEGFFRSQYEDENGTPSFLSTDEPAYVMYGPYIRLMPGNYRISVEYEYLGDAPEGTRIGYMDLNSTSWEQSDYTVPLVAGHERATVRFYNVDVLQAFEIRAFAETAGVHIKGVDIVRY